MFLFLAHGAFLELYNMDNFVKNFDKKECEPTRTKVFDVSEILTLHPMKKCKLRFQTSDVHKYVIFEESGKNKKG